MLSSDDAAARVKPIDGLPLNTYEDVRVAMREARLENGLTCAQLAEKLGKANSLVSLRENGHRVPSADALIQTFAALGKRLVLVDADPS